MQYISRKGSFDAGHRIMNERVKCHNIHGHTFLYELTFGFSNIESIGYQIDFKEIKRVALQWIDDNLDHAMLLNPQDTLLIETSQKLNSNYWLMPLNGEEAYCNPSVENIAKVIFLAVELLYEGWSDLQIHRIRLYETPNCFTDCFKDSFTPLERYHFYQAHHASISAYAKNKGKIVYDDRAL